MKEKRGEYKFIFLAFYFQFSCDQVVSNLVLCLNLIHCCGLMDCVDEP
jgi:hypothetical protein